MNGIIRAAYYARVSSQRQADEATIESQRHDISERLHRDEIIVPDERQFCDDGYSGSELLRPALEQLRDQVNYELIDRIYVHSPDRLARNFAHQVLLLDEFRTHDCEVIFLNQEGLPESAEANLLIQMQGMIAEYEREKILERTRRGRRFAAAAGKVSVFSDAPYGYRYISRSEGGGLARREIDPAHSDVVRTIFELVAETEMSLGGVCRELDSRKIVSPSGKSSWNRSTVRDILKRTAYFGRATYGKERLASRKAGKRAKRGDPAIPRRAKVAVPTQPDEQITIPVPPIISESLFLQVAERMEENQKRQREHKSGSKYLLSGLLVCGECQSAYCGRKQGGRMYYRCLGTDRFRAKTVPCSNTSVKGAELEEAVWSELCELLREPDRLTAELQRRREGSPPSSDSAQDRSRRQVKSLRSRIDRLIDAFESGLLEKAEFESRILPLRAEHDREIGALASLCGEQNEQTTAAAAATLESIAQDVESRLENADGDLKRDLIQLLIKRVEIHAEEIRIIYKVPIRPFVPSLAKSRRGKLHHCLLRAAAASRLIASVLRPSRNKQITPQTSESPHDSTRASGQAGSPGVFHSSDKNRG